MIKFVWVGVGGFLGSISRYLISGIAMRVANNPWFPFGTLTVNVLGCLIIGFLTGLVDVRQIFNPETRLLVFVGFLGGFTTFSSFGYETFALLQDGQFLLSVLNVLLNVILGLSAVYFGHVLSQLF